MKSFKSTKSACWQQCKAISSSIGTNLKPAKTRYDESSGTYVRCLRGIIANRRIDDELAELSNDLRDQYSGLAVRDRREDRTLCGLGLGAVGGMGPYRRLRIRCGVA